MDPDRDAELHEVEPREQVGAVTGERFDFQYHQAAADALNLLDDTQVICLYCEWHDDYVLESSRVVGYRFHQVKTRARSDGPWKLNEFFGVKKGRGKSAPPTGTLDSIFARMYEHAERFGTRCESFVFVTDAGLADDFQELVNATQNCTHTNSLPPSARATLARLQSTLTDVLPSLSEEALFSFVRRFQVREAVGSLRDLSGCRTLIGGRIYEASEVNLSMSEAQKIGADLVALIREKSHRTLQPLPSTTEELRAAKGLVLHDILRVLSLSSEGYKELQSGGRDAVVALSRLHRLCLRSSVPSELIPDLCRLKTEWDAWWVRQRHLINPLDHIALKQECAEVLRLHSGGKLDFRGLNVEAKRVAGKYGPSISSSEPLSDALVVGFMLSIAVEAEV